MCQRQEPGQTLFVRPLSQTVRQVFAGKKCPRQFVARRPLARGPQYKLLVQIKLVNRASQSLMAAVFDCSRSIKRHIGEQWSVQRPLHEMRNRHSHNNLGRLPNHVKRLPAPTHRHSTLNAAPGCDESVLSLVLQSGRGCL